MTGRKSVSPGSNPRSSTYPYVLSISTLGKASVRHVGFRRKVSRQSPCLLILPVAFTGSEAVGARVAEGVSREQDLRDTLLVY
jgi:hypothetical protein